MQRTISGIPLGFVATPEAFPLNIPTDCEGNALLDLFSIPQGDALGEGE
jgi:hypothetical protein